MKTLLLSFLMILSTNLFASPDPTDSVKVERVNHTGPIPEYTPFLSMYYYTLPNGDESHKMAFMMLVKDGEKIYFTPDKDKDCGGKNCKESYIVSVESSAPKDGILLETWLTENHTESLSRTDLELNGTGYDLCTFIVDISAKNPKKSRYKLSIGSHPEKEMEFEAGISTHEGGVVHWPGGN